MANLFSTLTTVLMSLAAVRCTNSKFKTVPTITNSLVNLGKMDISFYFNGRHLEDPTKPDVSFLPNLPMLRSSAVDSACPCSAFKSKDPFLTNPSDLIDKILRSNDLFRDPTSAHCCDSHEQIQESSIFFELGPKRAPMTINNLKNPVNPNPMRLPYSFRFPSSSGPQPMRPKAMEIFLFPKRKDIASMDVTKLATKPVVPKADIQMVGDKKIKPLNEGASVKKDLTSIVEKKETVHNDDELKVEIPVKNVNNAL